MQNTNGIALCKQSKKAQRRITASSVVRGTG